MVSVGWAAYALVKVGTDLSLRPIKTTAVQSETLETVFPLPLLLTAVLLGQLLAVSWRRVGVHYHSRLADHKIVEGGNGQGEEHK